MDALITWAIIGSIAYVIFRAIRRYRILHPRIPVQPIPARRAPDDPPSPEDTKAARNQLRLAHAHYEDMFKEGDTNAQLVKLHLATRALMQAGALDPNVTLTTEEKGETLTETQDQIAAKFLYCESLLQYTLYETEQKNQDAFIANPASYKEGYRFMERERKNIAERAEAHARNAIAPAEKAITYFPDNMLYLCHLVRVYRANGLAEKEREALARAQRLDPDNIEVLKLSQ